MQFGDRGIEVQELQELLVDEGYELPRFGADGHFGEETLRALNAYQKDKKFELTQKGEDVSSETLEELEWDAPEDPDLPLGALPLAASIDTFDDIPMYDLRNEPWELRAARKFRRKQGRPVIRDPRSVTGITIHQTAAKFGVAPYQVHAAGGDTKLALARRSLRVACHVMTFHDGFLAWPNPLSWYVYHGNGFNAFELGIEIDGCYPGVVGGKTWNGKKPTETTDISIRAARAGIRHLVLEGRALGMPIEYIHAHRQSSATRRDDPGEELWKKVVLEYAIPVLGLKVERGRVLKDGRPIPQEWDFYGMGKY